MGELTARGSVLRGDSTRTSPVLPSAGWAVPRWAPAPIPFALSGFQDRSPSSLSPFAHHSFISFIQSFAGAPRAGQTPSWAAWRGPAVCGGSQGTGQGQLWPWPWPRLAPPGPRPALRRLPGSDLQSGLCPRGSRCASGCLGSGRDVCLPSAFSLPLIRSQVITFSNQ